MCNSNEYNPCLASKPFLQKPVNYYDDWVYMGKEAYGSRKTNSASLKPGTKFFDVLGRAYGKMKARIKYYVRKDAIKKETNTNVLEFDVYARIIKDSEGNDIQVFIKEDKKNGLRRDSSFYWDGEWEVFEFDDAANETRFKASSDIRSLRKYDDKKRLTERYMVDGNGDTLTSEKYEWKNGRLVKTKIDGVERVYIYGKTLKDTVKVIPTDEGLNYHSGYNGTAGKIPEEDEPGYEIFAMSPYGHMYFNDNKSKTSVVSFVSKSSTLLMLRKDNPSNSCANVDIKEEPDMPEAQCIRLAQGEGIEHGYSNFYFYLTFECECNTFGKYQSSFTGETIDEVLYVHLSFWKHQPLENHWQEYCRRKNDLQRTYNHETKHIKNARYKASYLAKTTPTFTYYTKTECEDYGFFAILRSAERWDEWSELERKHKNTNPPSPANARDAYDYPCN